MHVAVDLHVHERTASPDCRTPAIQMLQAARRKLGEFAMVGFVGHDRRPQLGQDGVLIETGIEHERRPPPNRLHVIEFPDQDFRILAHPKVTWPTNTREHVHDYLAENPSIEAVEKWRGGRKQYRGHVPAIELGSSDAHNALLVGASQVVVSTSDVSQAGIFEAIRADQFQVRNRAVSSLARLAHVIEKAGAFVSADPSTAVRVGSDRIRATI